MLTPVVGLNVNAALGGWYGQYWSTIERGAQESGFLPQVSAGVVIAL